MYQLEIVELVVDSKQDFLIEWNPCFSNLFILFDQMLIYTSVAKVLSTLSCFLFVIISVAPLFIKKVAIFKVQVAFIPKV